MEEANFTPSEIRLPGDLPLLPILFFYFLNIQGKIDFFSVYSCIKFGGQIYDTTSAIGQSVVPSPLSLNAFLLSLCSHTLPPPQALATTRLFSTTADLSSRECHTNRIIRYNLMSQLAYALHLYTVKTPSGDVIFFCCEIIKGLTGEKQFVIFAHVHSISVALSSLLRFQLSLQYHLSSF